MKEYTKESLIESLIKIREMGWIPSGRKNNDGSVGNTLEDLLELSENNLPIPNASEWELKAQRKNTSSLVTLFHMEPSPRAFKFVPSILLPEFGWPHKEAGNKYPKTEMSFRQTISSSGFSNRGFTVKVDQPNQKVFIDYSFDEIDLETHQEWANNMRGKELEPQPYWGFNDLFHKAGTKLHNCFFARAEAKRMDGVLHFHYQDIFMLQEFSLERFIAAIEAGQIYVDFDARTGHNHGTKFRLRVNSLVDLYAKVTQF